jgi:hypothetical protein
MDPSCRAVLRVGAASLLPTRHRQNAPHPVDGARYGIGTTVDVSRVTWASPHSGASRRKGRSCAWQCKEISGSRLWIPFSGFSRGMVPPLRLYRCIHQIAFPVYPLWRENWRCTERRGEGIAPSCASVLSNFSGFCPSQGPFSEYFPMRPPPLYPRSDQSPIPPILDRGTVVATTRQVESHIHDATALSERTQDQVPLFSTPQLRSLSQEVLPKAL